MNAVDRGLFSLRICKVSIAFSNSESGRLVGDYAQNSGRRRTSTIAGCEYHCDCRWVRQGSIANRMKGGVQKTAVELSFKFERCAAPRLRRHLKMKHFCQRYEQEELMDYIAKLNVTLRHSLSFATLDLCIRKILKQYRSRRSG